MKIAFVLLRTLGDVILGNTLVNAVKKKYPDGEITYFVEEQYKEIIETNPNITEIRTPKNWDEILLEVSKPHWDIVMIPQQTSKTDNIWHHRDKYNKGHLLDFYAMRCGLEDYERRLFIYPKPEDEVSGFENCIVVHGTTLVRSKNWSKFSNLCSFIKSTGARVIQVGLPTDAKILNTEDLRGKFNLRQLYCLFKKCKCFIGLDSGLSYMAGASGVKTICIMGATIPTTSGPIGDNVRYIISIARNECARQRCHGNCKFNDPCIEKVGVERVLQEIR